MVEDVENSQEFTAEQRSSVVINKTEKPNSYECGKAGNRFKLYFDTVEELRLKLKKLEDSGLFIKE